MKNNGFIRLCLLASIILSGCSTAPQNFVHQYSLDDGKSLITDSRTRNTSNLTPGGASIPGIVDPRRIVCAEPSPDVAVTVANSFGSAISIMGQGSASVTSAQAEGIAQLAENCDSTVITRPELSCLRSLRKWSHNWHDL